VGLARLEAAQRGETVFVVAEDSAPVPLLERVNDARRVGATILALDEGDPELDALAHEALAVPESLSFDAGQHLVSAAAGERDAARAAGARGLRARLARLLDTVSGPSA
jgi:DNA-binding MurR/RpiR family transcriptional regulator